VQLFGEGARVISEHTVGRFKASATAFVSMSGALAIFTAVTLNSLL
jgi:hypothetical protein